MNHIIFVLLAASRLAFGVNLETVIQETIKKTQSETNSGVAIAIVKDKEIVFSKGYGYRDRKSEASVTADTLFSIASVTKGFTGTALAMAQDRGKLDLEEKVSKHLPSFKMKEAIATQKMTAIDLLSHRTGLPRHDILFAVTPFSRESLFKRLRYLAPHPKKGYGKKGFNYNNLMYMVAGKLLKPTTGMDWETYVAKNLFVPLGMKRTTTSNKKALSDKDYAKSYVGKYEVKYFSCEDVGASCSIKSSVNELSKWILFHLDGGRTPKGKALLSQKAHEFIFAAHNPNTGIEGQTYGLGWSKMKIGDRTFISHNGGIIGFQSYLAFVPEDRIGLVILINNEDAKLMNALIKNVQTELFGERVGEFSDKIREATGASLIKEAKSPRMLAPTQIPNKDIVGDYTDEGYGSLKVFEHKGKIKAKYYEVVGDLIFDEKKGYRFIISAYGQKQEMPAFFEMKEQKVKAIHLPFEPVVAPIRFAR